MKQEKNYVSRNNVEEVFKIIKNLQEAFPLQPVSKAAVMSQLRKLADAEDTRALSYRHLERSFKELSQKRIVRSARGQYWLPSYIERNIEYLKRESQLKELILKGVQSFLGKKIRELQEELFIAQDHEATIEEQAMHEEVLEEERRELDQFEWSRTKIAAPEKMRKRQKSTIDEELMKLFTRIEKATEMKSSQ